MSVLGPNGQPAIAIGGPEEVNHEIGGVVLKVFADPRVPHSIKLIPGHEQAVFIELVSKVNSYNTYINALVRECAALRERAAKAEERSKTAEVRWAEAFDMTTQLAARVVKLEAFSQTVEQREPLLSPEEL